MREIKRHKESMLLSFLKILGQELGLVTDFTIRSYVLKLGL